jgi:hypothetical protein
MFDGRKAETKGNVFIVLTMGGWLSHGHISNVFADGELDEKVVCRNFRLTTPHGAIEGKSQVNQKTAASRSNRDELRQNYCSAFKSTQDKKGLQFWRICNIPGLNQQKDIIFNDWPIILEFFNNYCKPVLNLL